VDAVGVIRYRVYQESMTRSQDHLYGTPKTEGEFVRGPVPSTIIATCCRGRKEETRGTTGDKAPITSRSIRSSIQSKSCLASRKRQHPEKDHQEARPTRATHTPRKKAKGGHSTAEFERGEKEGVQKEVPSTAKTDVQEIAKNQERRAAVSLVPAKAGEMKRNGNKERKWM
jgi:hypothetical protein